MSNLCFQPTLLLDSGANKNGANKQSTSAVPKSAKVLNPPPPLNTNVYNGDGSFVDLN